MARKTEGPHFFASKKGFFATHKGRTRRLATCDHDDSPNGPGYLAALEAYQAWMADPDQPGPGDTSIGAILALWEEHQRTLDNMGLGRFRSLARRFLERHARTKAEDFTTHQLHQWIGQQTTWGPSTKKGFFHDLKSIFKYAKEQGRITVNPLADAKRPASYHHVARGEQYVLPGGLMDVIVSSANEPYRSYLRALRATGARPGELANAEWWHYCPEQHCILFRADATKGYRWKNAKRKKHGDRDRRIYLTDEIDDLVRESAKRRGFLFPAKKAPRFTKNALTGRWAWVIGRPAVQTWMRENGFDAAFAIPYGFRHSWITHAIKQGIPIKLVADLTGTSVDMIEKHYSHATADTAFMLALFRSVVS